MDLAELLRSDDLFVHVSRRRWFGPRRLAVQARGGLALVQDRVPLLHRVIGRICVGWMRLDPAELHIVPQGGGAALVVRRRMFPMLPRAIELTDAAGQVIATAHGAWTLGRGLDLLDRHGKRAGRIRGGILARSFRVFDAEGRELGRLDGEGLGWIRGSQPGWRVTRGGDAGAGSMLTLLAAAFAVQLRWFDR